MSEIAKRDCHGILTLLLLLHPQHGRTSYNRRLLVQLNLDLLRFNDIKEALEQVTLAPLTKILNFSGGDRGKHHEAGANASLVALLFEKVDCFHDIEQIERHVLLLWLALHKVLTRHGSCHEHDLCLHMEVEIELSRLDVLLLVVSQHVDLQVAIRSILVLISHFPVSLF